MVASRLMRILGIEHLEYRLVHARICIDDKEYTTWLNRSRSFRAKGQRKQALDTFYDLNKLSGESPLDLCERFGWLPQIQRLMLVDYLIANRDRHGANIEVLQTPSGNVCLTPVFDSGLSFVFSCYDNIERVRAFDPLCDVNANNYLGTRSLKENLKRFVPAHLDVCALSEDSKMELFQGLSDALSKDHREKMWEIIWERWQVYAALNK